MKAPGSARPPGLTDSQATPDVDVISRLLKSILTPDQTLIGVSEIDRKDGRAVFRADIGFAESARPDLFVVAKRFTGPGRAERLYRTLASLYGAVFNPTSVLVSPRPLAYWDDLAVVVYEPVLGTPMHQLSPPEAAEEAARGAARWLATLHSSGIDQDRTLDVANEVANGHLWAEMVATVLGPSTTRIAQLADEVTAMLPALCLSTEAVLHKDFHYEHVLVGSAPKSGPVFGVIDLDETRRGDPAFDLAHFCSYLALADFRNGGSRFGAAARTFLDEYRCRTGWNPNEQFAFFGALLGLKQAKQIVTGRGPQVRPPQQRWAAEVDFVVEAALARIQ